MLTDARQDTPELQRSRNLSCVDGAAKKGATLAALAAPAPAAIWNKLFSVVRRRLWDCMRALQQLPGGSVKITLV